MTLGVFFTIFRILVYMWVGIESLFLSYLYSFGYKTYKQSPIVKCLQYVFFAIGGFFMAEAILPLIHFVNEPAYHFLIDHGYVAYFAIPIGFMLTKFRLFTLKETK